MPQSKESFETNKNRNGLHSATLNVLNWHSTHLKQTQPIMDKRLLMSNDLQTLDCLQIRGKEKKLSP